MASMTVTVDTAKASAIGLAGTRRKLTEDTKTTAPKDKKHENPSGTV